AGGGGFWWKGVCCGGGGAGPPRFSAVWGGGSRRPAEDTGGGRVAGGRGRPPKPAATPTGEPKSGGLSDSAVRVLMTYALSIIPDDYPGPDGKPIKVQKDDPNKFVIPVEDARRIIRAATRSAYAEVCDLKDLERANFQ